MASGFACSVASSAIAAVGYPVYLHFLGYDGYGIWLVLSTVLLMAQLGNFGISPAILKLVAEDFARGDLAGVRKYLTSALLCTALIGVVFFSGLIYFRPMVVSLFGLKGAARSLSSELLPYIGVLSIYAVGVDVVMSSLAGLGRYDWVNYAQTGSQFVTLCISVIFLALGNGIWSLLIGALIGNVFLNLAGVLLIRKILGGRFALSPAWDRERLRRMISMGSWVFGSSALSMLFNPLNRLLISRYIGLSSVTVYDIVYLVSMKFRAFLEVGFRALTPEFSSLQGKGTPEGNARRREIQRKGIRMVLYGGTASYLCVFILAGLLLKVWLGARFSPDLPPALRIMLCGTYFSLWGTQSYYILLGLGRSRELFMSYLIQSLVNVCAIALPMIIFHMPLTISAVVMATSLGMLAATIYLRWQNLRLCPME